MVKEKIQPSFQKQWRASHYLHGEFIEFRYDGWIWGLCAAIKVEN
jgi:hypothetical protein